MPEVFQLKITLIGTRPPIWRRVAVPGEFTLAQLHKVVQVVIGWEESHLHDFRIGKIVFGKPEPRGFGGFGSTPKVVNEKRVHLGGVLPRKGSKAVYTYDFGDGWEHSIVVEKIVPAEPDAVYPCCLAGALAGPPEDCGGLPGFYNLLDALADPGHEEHDDLMEWTGGGFDADAFSADAVNQQLWRAFRPTRKSPAKKTLAPPKLAELRMKPTPSARKRIDPEERLPLELSRAERQLILGETFAEDDLTNRLLLEPAPGQAPVYRYTLSDFDHLGGHIAAAANHASNKKLQKQLDALLDRIECILEAYTHGD